MMYGLVINPAFYLVVTVPLLVQKVLLHVPPYAIVAGNPANLFDIVSRKTIDKLENLAWWDWDISVIKGAIPLLFRQNRRIFTSPENESI